MWCFIVKKQLCLVDLGFILCMWFISESLLSTWQVWRGTSTRSSTGSTWLSLWSWKPSRVSSTTQSPTSHWPCPSTAGLERARTSWPEWSQTTCIATGWRASVSGSSSPPSTSRTPGWWMPIRWDVQRCVCTCGAGDHSRAGSIFGTARTVWCLICVCVYLTYEW